MSTHCKGGLQKQSRCHRTGVWQAKWTRIREGWFSADKVGFSWKSRFLIGKVGSLTDKMGLRDAVGFSFGKVGFSLIWLKNLLYQ